MDSAKKVRIVVGDDHPVVRIAARAILELYHTTAVVAETGALDELFAMLAKQECDVLILGLGLAGARIDSGTVAIAAIAAVRRRHPAVKIIVFPDSSDAQPIRIAISLGVLGVVSKHEIPIHLRSAVGAVTQGFRYVSSGVYKGALSREEVRRLSLDEQLLLQLIADGNSLDEVARILGEPIPVARHRKLLAMDKLGINTPKELNRFLATWRSTEFR